MLEAQAATEFDATLEGAPSGLAGQIGVRIIDGPSEETVIARTVVGITEYPAGSGLYSVTLIAPDDAGDYVVLWDTVAGGAPLDPSSVFTEALTVYAGPPPGAPLGAGRLATLVELKSYLHTQGQIAAAPAPLDDALLESMLDAASSRMIDEALDRTLELVPPLAGDAPVELGPFTVGPLARRIRVPDLREVTTITLNGRELEPNEYTLAGRPREVCALWVKLAIAPFLESELVITGRWGPAALKLGQPLGIAPHIREAAIVWTARVFHQRTSRFADNVQQDPQGGVYGYFRHLPPDVARVIQGLVIPGI